VLTELYFPSHVTFRWETFLGDAVELLDVAWEHGVADMVACCEPGEEAVSSAAVAWRGRSNVFAQCVNDLPVCEDLGSDEGLEIARLEAL
jgi:hypothetical protein